MEVRKVRELAPGYTSEVDTVDEQTWCQTLQQFDDANIYQTWPYGKVTSGKGNVSRLLLRKNGDIAAIAQARIAKLPLVNVGIAYVGWGPLWRRTATAANVETFRQAVRALRNEFVCRRGLVLRVFPDLFSDEASSGSAVLAEEGFSSLGEQTRGRTILMDLSAPLADLREGMNPHYKRELKLAERKKLEVVEGSDDELFAAFISIYKEMVARKKFVEPNDIHQFRSIQDQLPEKLKMRIMLCRSSGGVCAGLICSAMGKTAICLFGATGNNGIRSNGSYLLQWKLLERLKQEGVAVYNLNGINPARNPGTYKFKNDLAGKNGRDVYYLGRFDACFPGLSSWSIACGDRLRTIYRKSRGVASSVRGMKLRRKTASQHESLPCGGEGA